MTNMRYAPLSSSYMAVSIIGFLISVWFVMDLSVSWGLAFSIVFVLMFISSVISMSKSEPIKEHMKHLAIHEHKHQYLSPVIKPKWLEKKDFELAWSDLAFAIYFILAILYAINGFSMSAKPVTPVIFISILGITIIIAIAMIVEIISSERMKWYWQGLLTIFIIVSGPIGMLFYYIIRKIRYIV